MTRLWSCAALLLALSACVDGCAHEPARVEPLVVLERSTIDELERWTWPAGRDAWRPLAGHQLFALEQLVCLLIAEAERGRLSSVQQRRAARLAALVGVELRRTTIDVDGRGVELWILSEPADDRRGRGSYLIRIGSRSSKTGAELLLQAPHSRFDRRTGELALRLLVEGDAGSVRAVFLNSAHRYRQLDGSRTRREPPEQNPADAAHNPEHPLARTTAAVLARRELMLVQLHGFAPSAEAGDPELIVSSGALQPSRASVATVTRLQA